jgi:spoIIIJ-associated protein
MEEVERSAASVEEAIEAALDELGVSEQEARIEIVQEPRPGSPQPAIVRVRAAASAAVEAAPADGQGEAAEAFLEALFEAMGIDVELEIASVEGTTYVDVWAVGSDDDMGLLIGKGGHTIDALQELMRASVARELGARCVVMVDVEDYRKRRRSQIGQRAREVARRVGKTGKAEALEPMSSYDRKFVHDTVAEFAGLETASEGEEPQRRVVVRRKA